MYLGQWYTRVIFEINQTELALQDLALNLDELTELQDSSVFRLQEGSTQPIHDHRKILFGILIQMNMDQTLIERNGYTILDLLSDVGGLQGILTSGIYIILGILNHNHLSNYLVSRLFKSSETHRHLTTSSTESMKNFCLSKCLPRKLACCSRERKQRVMEQALAALEKEVQVINLIRSRRFVHRALKHLLDPALRKELKLQSECREIRIDQPST